MKFIVSRFYTPKNVVLEYLLEGDACYFDTVGNSRFVDFEFLVDYLCFSSVKNAKRRKTRPFNTGEMGLRHSMYWRELPNVLR